MCNAHIILDEWHFHAEQDCQFPVLPDGCHDVIVAWDKGHPRWFIADLADASYQAHIKAGAHMRGLRFRPGVAFDEVQLEKFMCGRDPVELFNGDSALEFVLMADGISEMLEAFSAGQGCIQQHAKQLGVSVRTLQRTMKSATGCSPLFWIHLARVRKVARALKGNDGLSSIAAAHGYADQAHMTRDIKRWMGVTPEKFKADPHRMQAIQESGYG